MIAIGLTPELDFNNAISFCNVLFIGNLCGGLVTFAIAGPRRLIRELRAVRGRAWIALAVTIILAIFIPLLIFTALTTTSVTNVILLGRLESVAFAVASLVFFRTPIGRWQAAGLTIITAGVLTLVLVTGMGQVARGDWLVIGSTALFGLAACTSKLALRHLCVQTFVFLRNFASAIVFFCVALIYYGPAHFGDAFGPELWLAMLVYGGAVVVLAQLAWYRALNDLPSATIGTWANLTPVLALFFAAVLLGERPGLAQSIGGVVIIAGMLIAGRDKRPMTEGSMENSLAAA